MAVGFGLGLGLQVGIAVIREVPKIVRENRRAVLLLLFIFIFSILSGSGIKVLGRDRLVLRDIQLEAKRADGW